MNVAVILTCFNRSQKTSNCLKTLITGNPSLDFRFIVVNDGSTDDTAQELSKIDEEYHNVTLINTEGSLYYSKSMRRGMEWLNSSGKSYDYVLLVNDDVAFNEGAVEKLIKESEAKDGSIIVGATCDDNRNFTYGGVRNKGAVAVEYISNEHPEVLCDSFNANCALIPWKDYVSVAPMDGYYAHAMGDFDYGFDLHRHGAKIYTSSFLVGVCNRNPVAGTWGDRRISFAERLRKKESPKGLPFKSYFHYLKKNYGILKAVVFSVTPYVKILLGK